MELINAVVGIMSNLVKLFIELGYIGIRFSPYVAVLILVDIICKKNPRARSNGKKKYIYFINNNMKKK